MSKSIKLKNGYYIDDSGVVHYNTPISDYINKMDNSCNQVINGWHSIGQNPSWDNYNKVGFYPFYEGRFTMENNTTESITWGCMIVIPYNYGQNETNSNIWCIQVAIGGTGWDSTNTCKILVRRINYYGGGAKWNKLM